MQVQSLSQKDPLEEEITTCFTIFAWKIPWTEEPGRLQSMGSQSDMKERLTEHHVALSDFLPVTY